MKLYYCDHHPIPLPAGHKFPLTKYLLLRQALERTEGFEFEAAPLADTAAIERAHDPAYVRAFLEGTLDAAVVRRIGFPWSEGLVTRTLASVGATLAATEEALRSGFGGTLAGGTHHAFYAEGSGFCVFNDIAVAIRHYGFLRAAVLDLDVHQGDGAALIFTGDPRVLTISLHGAQNFPFRKQTSSVDLEFGNGTEDLEYLAGLRSVLPKVTEFAPEIVFYQAGVDGLATDKLGRLGLTQAGLEERDRLVFATCRAAGIPVITMIGGGYSEPIDLTVAAHAQTFNLARSIFA